MLHIYRQKTPNRWIEICGNIYLQQILLYNRSMNYPHVTFQYDIDKDLTNLQIGLDWVGRGAGNDGEINQIIKTHGKTPTNEQLKIYIKDWWTGREHLKGTIIGPLQKYWDSIEQTFFEKLYEEMQLTSWYTVEEIQSFLSIRYGCGYNANENWFATSVHSGPLQNTRIAVHEIMHIFFHKQWWQFCKEQNVDESSLWDIKESFTTLLNTWFRNELADKDFGYPQHRELREKIREWYTETDDFKETLIRACAYVKEHPIQQHVV
jgi:hypothetical protein